MSFSPRDTGVLITMAGAGSRFAEAGYTVPKYEIVAHGRTLFSWSMESLRSFIDAGSAFTFVAQDRPGIEAFIAAECRALGVSRSEVVLLQRITDGQATTAMLAQSSWDDPARPLAIYNIDTFVSPDAMSISSIRGNGWIPCFPGEGDKWSFAAANEQGLVSEVREKKRISPHATVGLYWFDSFVRYSTAYEQYYADPRNLEARERYVAPLYNHMIGRGAQIYLHDVPAASVHPLGTPDDVRQFEATPAPAVHLFATAS